MSSMKDIEMFLLMGGPTDVFYFKKVHCSFGLWYNMELCIRLHGLELAFVLIM